MEISEGQSELYDVHSSASRLAADPPLAKKGVRGATPSSDRPDADLRPARVGVLRMIKAASIWTAS